MTEREMVIEDLLDFVEDLSPFAGDHGDWLKVHRAIKYLQEHVEQKKGFWLYPTSLDCHCSVCGEQPEHEPGESVPLYDYCPYCGAKMEAKWDER